VTLTETGRPRNRQGHTEKNKQADIDR